MRRVLVFALLLFAVVLSHAQTLDVTEFPGSTVGTKLTFAQAACSTQTTCVLVFKPELDAFPVGALPPRCATCVWADYRTRNAGLDVVTFGADPTGMRDSGAAWAAAIAAACAAGKNVTIPAGTYITTTRVLVPCGIRLVADSATLHYTGAGDVDAALKFSPSAPGADCTVAEACIVNAGVTGLTIKGNAHTTNVLMVVSTHHADFRNVRLFDGVNCFTSQFAVLNTYDKFVCTDNEGAVAVQPRNGIVLDELVPGAQSTSSTFTGVVVEGVSGKGIWLKSAANNQFVAGTSEGNGVGVQLESGSTANAFYGTDFEANSASDIEAVAGIYNAFYGVTSANLAHVGAAGATLFSGGTYKNITVDAGAGETRMQNVVYTGTLTNNSTTTYQRGNCSMGCVNSDEVIPHLKSATGTRFLCIDVNGKIISSATACSGT